MADGAEGAAADRGPEPPAAAGPPHVEPARRGRGPGYLLVVLVSVVLGVVGVIPFVLVPYALEQLVLAPLGLAAVDPTNDDGDAVVVVLGVVAPLVVAGAWAVLVAAVARRYALRSGCWGVSAVCLTAPTIAHVAARLG